MKPYDQPTLNPTPKIKAVGIAGLIVPAVVAVLAAFGVILPDGLSTQVEAAITAILVVVSAVQAVIQFAAGYLKRDEE